MRPNNDYRIFIDDIRMPADVYGYTNHPIYILNEWIIVRSYEEFIKTILYSGIPDVISFDHDLGFIYDTSTTDTCELSLEKTGYDCAKWLINYCMDTKLSLPKYLIHSRNPVGSENIRSLLDNYHRFELNR